MSMPRMTFDQAHSALLNFIPKAKELIEEGTEHAHIAQKYLVKAEALLSQITDTKKNDIEINGIINANLKDLNRFIDMMPLMESELTPPPPPPIESETNTATAPQAAQVASQPAPQTGNTKQASVVVMFDQLDSNLSSLFDTVKAKGGDAKLEGTLNDLLVSCRTIPNKSSAKPDGGLAEMLSEMAKACKAHNNTDLIKLTSSTASKCKDKSIVDADRAATLIASITAPKAAAPKAAVSQSHEQTNHGPSHKMK